MPPSYDKNNAEMLAIGLKLERRYFHYHSGSNSTGMLLSNQVGVA